MTYVAITFIVLLFLNIYSTEVSHRLFYTSKKTAMLEKAQLTANEIGNLDVLTSEAIDEIIQRIGSMNFTRLMVTDANGMVIHDSLKTDLGSYAILPHVVTCLRGKNVFSWHFSEGVMRSVAATPIYQYDTISGCVYMLEYDPEQGQQIASLQGTIFRLSLILEIGLLLFAILYATRFSLRLRKIMQSMKVISDGDYSHKLSLSGHDELSVLSDEINTLTEKLSISEGKRRRFVSDASHELKTPLASIKLLSDSILQNNMDMETTREFVSDIGNEAERLNRMTQKLLALTKTENLTAGMEAEIIDVAPTVERVVRMLDGIAEMNEITLHLDILQDSSVLITEDDLYQITFNLVENGIKYNVPGGTLCVTLRQDGELAVLQVADSGIGIPADALEHVFERFYRVDKARSRQTGGSGLGLSIVRAIVARYNGEIRVESTEGKGTVFTVEFPRFELEEAEDL